MKSKLFFGCQLAALTLALAINPFAVQADEVSDADALRAAVIASNPLHEQEVSMDALLLPKHLYILKGTSTGSSRLTLYYRNMVLSPATNYTLTSTSTYGKSLQGRWFYDSNLFDPLANQDFDLNFSLTTPSQVLTGTTSVEVVDRASTNPVRLLAIGDSITRMGNYLNQVEKILPNSQTIGTAYTTGPNVASEGRGGWTLEKYFTYIGRSDVLDSPFVFPTSINGRQYKGNTADWKKICSASSTDSAYGGFQKLARGWKDQGPYLYNANGYYKYPAVGDVMVDPTLPKGQQWITWSGKAWIPMTHQPTTFAVDFSKYMARFKAAFPEGGPTHVSILLGANDFGTFDTLMDMSGYLSYLEELINSIHQYDASIKVIVCTPTLGPSLNKITENTESYARYDRNIKLAAYYLMKKYDNAESMSRNIYIAPLTLTLDTTNGFDYVTTQVMDEDGNLLTKVSPKNTLHPNVQGHIQIGNTLAAVIQKTR